MSNASPDFGRTVSAELLKGAPPWLAWVFSPSHWLLALSTLYVALQIAYLLWRWRRERREARRLPGDNANVWGGRLGDGPAGPDGPPA